MLFDFRTTHPCYYILITHAIILTTHVIILVNKILLSSVLVASIRFEQPSYDVTEGDGDVTLGILLVGDLDIPVSAE